MTKARMEKVFLLETEEPEDSFFSPTGVIVVGEKQKITLFCQNAMHNLYRSAVIRHDWPALEQGVVYRSIGFRVRDLTSELAAREWTDMNALPHVLSHIQGLYPRHLYFLAAAVQALS